MLNEREMANFRQELGKIFPFKASKNDCGVKLTTHLHLAPSLGMCVAVDPQNLCLNEVHRNNFFLKRIQNTTFCLAQIISTLVKV